MDAPAASGIGFHEVEESTVTVAVQPLAKNEAMAPDEQFLAPQGMTEATIVGIRSQVHVIERVPDRLVPRKSNGDEVGQKGGRQGGEIGHRHGIYRVTAESMSQKLVSNISVQLPDVERLCDARKPVRAVWDPLVQGLVEMGIQGAEPEQGLPAKSLGLNRRNRPASAIGRKRPACAATQEPDVQRSWVPTALRPLRTFP
jgi:hypothetical protein